MSNSSQTTKLLMSAAHLYPADFKEDLNERLEHPYKSPALEFGINLSAIKQELEKANGSHLGKSVFLLVIVLIAFFVFIQDPEDNWGIAIIALGLTSIAEFVYTRAAKKNARKIMKGKETDENIESNTKEQKKNIVISGGYLPFVGAGFDLDSWSFTVNLNEPEDKQRAIGVVSATELHDYIKGKLYSLKIEGMEIADELFVNGKDVNLLAHLLPNGRMAKPVDAVDQQYILSKVNNNEKRERHYRVVRISMWDGQLILSMYYRFLIINNNLFTEARFFLLPPLKEKYLEIENIPLTPTKKEFVGDLVHSVFVGAFSWVAVVIRLLTFVQGGFMANSARQNQWEKEVEYNRLYNYGWESSLREKWSSLSYERYFQKVDKDVALKLITNEFLASLRNYLSERNISTDQFTQTTTKIVNEGVIISGGDVKAESFAVGKGARIAKNAFKAVKGGGNA